ncbi:hypothetical protein JG688_00001931 [Phytophthora aleatoria]|uniref:HECT domain-containing protein n=1 Tax=Phytophthora aleatoria TaxID=2496075 RepID=A0A8J5MB53_9STRA|nr:hypothetical protein JG688_00001931 [Phytophthora aleatoria]
MAPPRRFVETEETFHFFNEDAVLGTNEIRSGDASSSSSDSDSSEISRLRRAHRRRRASSVASRRTSRRLSRLLNGSVVSELESLQDDSDEDDYDSLDDFELEDDDEEIHQPRERKESTDKADAEPHNTPPAAVANTKVPGVGAVTFEQIFEPFRDLARRAITAFTRRVHCANAYRYRKQSEFMRVCYQRTLEAGPGYEVVETSKLSDKLNEGKKQALLVASQKEDAVETTVPSLFPRKWPHLPFRSVLEWHSDTDAAIEFLSRLAELPETSLIYEPIDAGKFAAEVTELLELTRRLFAMGVQLQSFTLLSKAALQFIELGQSTYLGDADGGSIRPELQKLLELYCSRLAQHVAEPILAATFPRDLSAQWKVCSYQPSTSDAIATDGLYLYIFGRSGLFKIGTGNGTTVRDFVYAHNKEYVRSRDAERSWLCCIGDALYCRTIVMPGHRVDRKGTTESSVYAMVTDGVDLFTIRCIDTYKKSSSDLLRILMETVQEFEFVGVTMNIDASDEATQELFKDTEPDKARGGHTGVVYSYAFGNDDIVIANLDGFTDGARNGEAASDDDICFCKRTTSEVKAISGVPSFSSMAPAWPSLFDNQVISTNGNCPAIIFQLAQMCVRDLKVEDIADMRELLWNMEWLRSRDLHFSLATRPISSSSFSVSDDKTCVLRPPTSALEDSSAFAPVASDGSQSVPEPSEYFYNLYAFSSRSDLPQHSGRNKMLEYWEKNVIPAIETYIDDLEVGGRYVIASENVDVADWSRDMLWTLGHSGTVRVVDPSGMVLLQVVNPVTSASEYWWYHVDNLRAMSSGTSVSEQSVTDFEASRTRLKMMNQQLIYSIARKSVFDLLQVAPEHAMKISIETRKTILARTSSSPLPLPSSLSVGHAPAATMQLTAPLPKNPGNRYDLADLLRLAAAADLGCPEKVLSSEIGMLSDSTPGAPTENSSSLYLRPKISPKSALITVLQTVLNKQFERAAVSPPPPVMDRSTSYDENASVMVTKPAKKHKKRGKQGASDPFVSFIVIFAGENVVGEGGPYRQLFNDISNELLASGNPLFIPTQNNVMKAGEFRERYMPKPSSTSKELLQMFEFVGILMGCCLRTGVRLNLRLAPLVWKMLVKQNLVLTDLESVDYSLCESLKFLEELASASSDDPNEVLYDSFTTTLSDGTVVELKTGGQQLSVTKANAKEYIRLVKATRLQECKPQVDAMLRGLGKIVPVQLLQLCVWSELQQWVSGSLEIDVNLLKRHTRYSSGMSPEQFPHLEMFWKVLSSFSEENKRRFINFAWGQDTLPADDAEFDRTHTRLLIKAPPQDSGMNQDALLPKADTCFFNIELPVYSSEKIMREKLLLAITLCTSLDGDEQTASHDIYYAGDEIDDDAME